MHSNTDENTCRRNWAGKWNVLSEGGMCAGAVSLWYIMKACRGSKSEVPLPLASVLV